MSEITVYHATPYGNGSSIVNNGWEVTRSGVNIYGRGIYFWELIEDAHSYGEEKFGDYEIVEETIPFTSENHVIYSHKKAVDNHIDDIAQSLLSKNIDVIVIPNPYIETTTMIKAKGKAYLWLVDMNQPIRFVRF